MCAGQFVCQCCASPKPPTPNPHTLTLDPVDSKEDESSDKDSADREFAPENMAEGVNCEDHDAMMTMVRNVPMDNDHGETLNPRV